MTNKALLAFLVVKKNLPIPCNWENSQLTHFKMTSLGFPKNASNEKRVIVTITNDKTINIAQIIFLVNLNA